MQPCMTVMAVAVTASATPKNGVLAVCIGLSVPTIINDPETNKNASGRLTRKLGPDMFRYVENSEEAKAMVPGLLKL